MEVLVDAQEEPFYPDGLTDEHIEALLSEARAVWATSAGATSALLDGSAAERRRRRMSRRAISAVVRSLPTTDRPSSHQDGEVA
jgi:hypothetical protein